MAKNIETTARKQSIGRTIRIARLRRKLSAITLALKCNVTRGAIYQWEEGDFVLPKNLRKLAPILKVPLKTLEAVNGKKPGRVAGQKN